MRGPRLGAVRHDSGGRLASARTHGTTLRLASYAEAASTSAPLTGLADGPLASSFL
jgi:hypothetical protein